MNDSGRLRWGILGTGMIAGKFAAQLDDCPRGELIATGSRTPDSATRFAAEHGGTAHGSYGALIGDPDIDAIYVALPNAMHHAWTLCGLEAGKHVLCEKPLAANAAQAAEVFDAAQRTERVLVEAFMYRSLPLTKKAIELARSGALGEVKLIHANFSYYRDAARGDIRYQPELAGGALMDVGCYCINFARTVAGEEPTALHVEAHLHDFGVDDYAAGTLRFGDKIMATFTCGMTVEGAWTVVVAGTDGYLVLEDPWFGSGPLTVVRGKERAVTEGTSRPGPYALEAERFAAAVFDGAPPPLTREDSLGNMYVLDKLRQRVGMPTTFQSP